MVSPKILSTMEKMVFVTFLRAKHGFQLVNIKERHMAPYLICNAAGAFGGGIFAALHWASNLAK